MGTVYTPLALPLGELSPQVTERACFPLSVFASLSHLSQRERQGVFAYAEEDCPYVRSSSRKPWLKNSLPSASTHMASAL